MTQRRHHTLYRQSIPGGPQAEMIQGINKLNVISQMCNYFQNKLNKKGKHKIIQLEQLKLEIY